jgi:hypothetical protein
MTTETIEYKGFKILIHQDQYARNPFEDGDCEPPIAVYCERGVTRYGNAADIADLVNRIPAQNWKGEKRNELLGNLNVTAKEFADYKKENGYNDQDAFSALMLEKCPEPDRSWSEAKAHFETLELLAAWAGIATCYKRSNGYCQGDSALVIAFATPEWAEMVGAPKNYHASQCESAVDLYTAWAWGDCYGYTVEDEEENEVDDASCWGFYGSDHKTSRLLESAENAIDCHIAWLAKENTEREAMESRDIVTVA